MRQFRLPQLFQTVPATVQGLPASLQNAPPRIRLILGVVFIAALLALSWTLFGGGGGGSGHVMAPAPVHVASATRGDLPVVEHAIGTMLANASVQMTTRISGQIMSANFKEGQIVHRGDLLFQIDPRPYQAALDQAEGALRRDQAQYVAAARTAKRYQALAKENAIATALVDQNVANARALAATVVADKAAVEMAKLNLSYTEIRSPIDGKTGPILVYPGNQVVAAGASNSASSGGQTGTSQGSSSTLVVINQIEPVKLSFFLPQSDLPLIQQRMRQGNLVASVQIHGADANTPARRAPVDFVSNSVDQSTGTIELRATFPNTDDKLVPGELADVSVTLRDIENAVIVPHGAVNLGQDNRYVFVVTKDGKADMRPVTVLHDDGTKAAIEGNVRSGDKVVTEGQLRLTPDAPVVIVPPAAPGHGGDAT